MKHVYLAGAIAFASDAAGWRKSAAAVLRQEGIEALDPLNFEVSYDDPESIVRLDYGLILRSQAVLAFVGEPSWGTAMELAFAKHHDIPVFAFHAGGFEGKRISPWVTYHCKTLNRSCESAILQLLGRHG